MTYSSLCRLIVGTIVVLLGACAVPEAKTIQYTKAGASEEQFIADRETCTARTRQAFNPYEDYGSPVFRSTQSEKMIGARLEVERLFHECMVSHGWAPE